LVGIGGLVGAIWLKRKQKKIEILPSNSVVFSMLGCFILWFGWFGFNPGSTQKITGDYAEFSATIALNTALSPCFAGTVGYICACIYEIPMCNNILKNRNFKIILFPTIINSILAGAVAITGPCAIVSKMEACFIGGFATLGYLVTDFIVCDLLRIDDPMKAFAIHAGGGCVGLIAGSIGMKDLIILAYPRMEKNGSIPSHAVQLGIQLAGIAVIFLISGIGFMLTFGLLQFVGKLEIRDEELEIFDKYEWEQEEVEKGVEEALGENSRLVEMNDHQDRDSRINSENTIWMKNEISNIRVPDSGVHTNARNNDPAHQQKIQKISEPPVKDQKKGNEEEDNEYVVLEEEELPLDDNNRQRRNKSTAKS